MRLVLMFFFLVCFGATLIGQGAGNVLINWGTISIVKDEEAVEGAPDQYFLDEKWSSGEFLTRTGSTITVDRVRLNLTTRSYEVQVGEEMYIADTKVVESLTLMHGGKKYKIVNTYVPDINPDKITHLIQLVDGPEYQLFKTYTLKVKKANYNPVLDTGRKTDSVTRKEVFVYYDNSDYIVIPNSGRKAKKVLSKVKGAKQKIKKNNINLKKEEDLVSLFNLINK